MIKSISNCIIIFIRFQQIQSQIIYLKLTKIDITRLAMKLFILSIHVNMDLCSSSFINLPRVIYDLSSSSISI